MSSRILAHPDSLKKAFYLPRFKALHWGGLFLLALALLATALTGLGGEYPLNDDWIYAAGVASWLAEGEVTYYAPVAPNLILQVLWGGVCCLLGGGFSFVALRVSTLLLAGVGLVAFYQFIKVVTGEQRLAFAAGLILLTNPIYYNLSFSFMTDVPFTALVLVGLWQYALYFRDGRTVYRVLGAVAAIAAFGIRQPGLMLWFSAEAVILLRSFGAGRTRVVFLLQLLGMAGVFLLLEYGIKARWVGPGQYLLPSQATILSDIGYGLGQWVKRYGMAVFYIGLFGLPFIPYTVATTIERRWYRRTWFLLLVGLNVGLLAVLAYLGRVFPYGGHTIYNFGLGTPLLPDFHYWRLRQFPQVPVAIVMVLGLVVQQHSFLLLRLLGARLWALVSSRRLIAMDAVVLLFAIPYTGIVFFWGFFDRYVLLLFLLVGYLIGRVYPRLLALGRAQSVILLVLLGYAVAGTRDYLAWNETVRREKLAWLAQTNNERASLTAGYAQDGWDSQGHFDRSAATYYFTWGPVAGFTTLDTIAYSRWLPGQGRIYLVQKN